QTLSVTRLNGVAVSAGTSVATAHGTVVLNADGTVTYTPAPDYNGQDGFSYTARDSGVPPAEASANGYVTINPVNDAPVPRTTGRPPSPAGPGARRPAPAAGPATPRRTAASPPTAAPRVRRRSRSTRSTTRRWRTTMGRTPSMKTPC